MFHKRIEIAILMQQFVPALDTTGSYQRVNGLADRDAGLTQHPEILRRLNRNLSTAYFHNRLRGKNSQRYGKLAIVGEALEHLRQNQIADHENFAAQQLIEAIRCRSSGSVKVVDPDARIDQGQRS